MTVVEDFQYSQDFKNYVMEVTRYVLNETYHTRFELSIVWQTEDDDDGLDGPRRSPFSVYIMPEYLKFCLYVYPVAQAIWKAGDYRSVADGLVHEVCHTFFAKHHKLIRDEAKPSDDEWIRMMNEEATQQVASVIGRLFNAITEGWYLPKAEEVVEEAKQACPKKRRSKS